MSVERQPLNITINRVPTRISGVNQPGGYQVINRDLQATVWVAANPSVADGNGTPISPGTSLTWMTSDDIWLVLGNDAQSATVPNGPITIAYDSRDWDPSPAAVAAAILNSGVLIIDQPLTVLNAVPLAFPAITAPANTARYNSAFISIQPTGVPWTVQIQWVQPSGFGMPINIWGNGTDQWTGWVPIQGATVTIQAIVGAVTVTLILSNRQRPQQIQYVSGIEPNLCRASNAAVAAGGALTLIVPPWFGNLQIWVAMATPGVAGLLGLLQVIDGVTATAIVRKYVVTETPAVVLGSGRASVEIQLARWGGPCQINVNNTSAVACGIDILVTPQRLEP